MAIRSVLKWLGFGVLCYLLLAIYSAPASLAVSALPNSMTASGVTGSLWNGEADLIRQGDVALQNVSWSLKPLRLLTLKASAEVNGKVLGNSFAGVVNKPLLGNSGSASDVRAVIDLSSVNSLLKLPIPVHGKAGLVFESLHWKDQLLAGAVGNIQLADLTEMVSGTNLGNFKINFEEQSDDTLLGVISDVEALIEVAGQIAVSGNDYQLQLDIKPNAKTPNSISTVLSQWAGQPNREGAYRINTNGQLDPNRASTASAPPTAPAPNSQ